MQRLFIVCSLALFILTAAHGFAQTPSGPPIAYTGRLLGYFRWPDQQSTQLRDCQLSIDSGDPHRHPNANATSLLAALGVSIERDIPAKTRVMVGMGDNFAPELFSRTMDDLSNPRTPKRILKDQYSWDGALGWVPVAQVSGAANALLAKGRGRIGSDNVACFLRKARYDAIVPGEYDFQMGPERLREIARFLNYPLTDEFPQVRMLGANLAIETTINHAPGRVPDWEKHLEFSTVPGTQLSLSISDGDQVLPWLREITATGLTSTNTVVLCREANAGVPDSFIDNLRKNECRMLDPLTAPDGKVILRVPDGTPGDLDSTFLQPNTNYAVCVKNIPTIKPSTYCARFTVLTPFFTYPDAIRTPSASPSAPYPPPYAITTVGNTKVAIFGIVDPTLNQKVGLLNYGWINTDADGMKVQEQRSTRVKVLNPVVALRQTLQYFKEAEPGFSGMKILLAQLPRHQVTELAAQFKEDFHVVIAAADLTRATGDTTVAYPMRQLDTNTIWGGPSPVTVVPKPVYDPAVAPIGVQGPLTLQADELRLFRQNCAPPNQTCRPSWLYINTKLTPQALQPSVRTALLECGKDFDKLLSTALGVAPCNPAWQASPTPLSKLQDFTFQTLQRHDHVDVLLLQKRDWFPTYVERMPTAADLQDVLDRVFYKGDFKTKTVITGKALKEVMTQSKAFDKEDANDLAPPHLQQRGLIARGIMFDAVKEQYVVNASPVVDDKLYSVIVSDYIGAGDTGYEALKTGAVNDPIHPSPGLRLMDISMLVCNELQSLLAYPDHPCRDRKPLSGETYFDFSAIPPTDVTKGMTATRHFLSWATFWRIRPGLYKDKPPLETAMQTKTVWSVSLEKAEFGYDYKNHNRNAEDQVRRQFKGVSAAGVADAKQTKTITYDWRIRTTRGLLFGLNEAEYENDYIRGADPSIPKNKLAFEGGITPRLYPRLKETRALMALVSVRWETKLVRPLLALPEKKFEHIDKDKHLLFKEGLRFQNVKSWAEGGYQFGYHYAPEQYVFNAGMPTQFSCSATSVGVAADGKTPLLDECLAARKTDITSPANLTVQQMRRGEHGLFLNFHIEVPLPFRNELTYIMENTGDAFFNRGHSQDLPIDTRFLDRWSNAISIPLVGNLSLEPKIEYFYFRNKVNRDSLSSWKETIAFRYNLDWHNGVPRSATLRYKNTKR